MINPVLRLVLQKLNANAAECERLAGQVAQHAETINRMQDVQQIEVAAMEVLDRKLEQILLKLEHRDG